MKQFIILVVVICCLILNQYVLAYDEKISHPQLTDAAIGISELDTYLKSYIGLTKGIGTITNGVQIKELIKTGSRNEDSPLMRAENHFWNPYRDEGLDDSLLGYHFTGLRNRAWALALESCCDTDCDCLNTPGVTGNYVNSNQCNDYSWTKARQEFYQAMTSTDEAIRNAHFRNMYESLGRILHLMEDMGVPAHTRDDFTGHLDYTGLSWPPEIPFGNLYENYVKTKASPRGSAYISNFAQSVTVIPKFDSPQEYWGAGNYVGLNPEITLSGRAGLAEYSNANFLSRSTLFTSTYAVNDKHYFPYPRASSLDKPYLQWVTGSNGTSHLYWYFNKVRDGEPVDHFAAMDYLSYWEYQVLRKLNYDDDTSMRLESKLDDKVHEAYAQRLIPRTIGYSAGLINYFFRGRIELSIPSTGLYAFSSSVPDDPRTQGFTSLSVLVKNPNGLKGEQMNSGNIALVVRYRLPDFNPLENYALNQAVPGCRYIVKTCDGAQKDIPSDAPRQLDFDLSGSPIPVWAMDVSIFIVYQGMLGKNDNSSYVEQDAVCVGYKDISEPTPVDIMNNDDALCANHRWYSTNSAVFHDIYLKFYPESAVNRAHFPPTLMPGQQHASSSNYDYRIESLPSGQYKRLYILSDSRFGMSINFPGEYNLSFSFFPPNFALFESITNKTEYSAAADPNNPYIFSNGNSRFTFFRDLYYHAFVSTHLSAEAGCDFCTEEGCDLDEHPNPYPLLPAL